MAAYTAIDDPEAYFQTVLYTGDASTQSVTLPGDTDMQPDLVWIKNRDEDQDNAIFDSVRGTQKQIKSNTTEEELTRTDALSAFNTDGFTVGSRLSVNGSADKIVAWCWKESATAGFDIVSYTGNGSTRTISHSLSAVPHLMLLKDRDAAKSWVVYHHKNTSAPETEYLLLEGTGATTDSAVYFNDTAPTSSVFTVSTGTDANADGDDFISYHWTSKQGFSKFGSFLSNGNADGAFCYLGFRAAYILMKKSSGAGTDWYIFYNKSPGYNENNKSVRASQNHDEEQASGYPIDILSNGFKIRTDNTAIGEDAATFVYAAFAEAPFVNSKGVPCNAR